MLNYQRVIDGSSHYFLWGSTIRNWWCRISLAHPQYVFVLCWNLEHVLLPWSTTLLYTRRMFVATTILSLDSADGISEVGGYLSTPPRCSIVHWQEPVMLYILKIPTFQTFHMCRTRAQTTRPNWQQRKPH